MRKNEKASVESDGTVMPIEGSGTELVSSTENVGADKPKAKRPLSKKAKITVIALSVLLGLGLVVGLVFLIIGLLPREPEERVVFAYGEFDYVILEDDTLEIVAYHGSERNIRIPTVIDNREVSSIGDEAFLDRTSLLTVQLGGFVKRIGASAFAGCTTMSEVIIPQSVTEIGEYAFYNCMLLKEIELPLGLTSLGRGAFASAGLESFSLPEGVTAVPDEAFMRCLSLLEVTLGEGVKSIGVSAFYGCTLIESLDLPYVERIEDGAFADCTALVSVSLGASLKYIGEGVFYQADTSSSSGDSATEDTGGTSEEDEAVKLASITVPPENTHFTSEGGALVSIDDKRVVILPPASGVESYTMPDYVEHISDYAFGRCESIKEIILSPVLKTVGYGAFHTTVNLARIALTTSAPEATFDFPATLGFVGGNAFENNRAFKLLTDEFTIIGDGILVRYYPQTDKNGYYITTEHTTPASDGELSVEVRIPEGVRIICSAFSGQSRVKKVVGSTTLVEIGEYSFYDGGILEVVDLSPSAVTRIGNQAFSGARALKTVIFPETLTEVGEMLFFGCYALESITLPSSLTYVSEKMFADCIALKSVTLGENTREIGLYAFYGAAVLEEIELPASIERLSDYAFAKTGIEEFTVPAGVEIGTGLLLDATELKKITISGEGATPEALCMGAVKLETVIFDGDFTAIGKETFYNCSMLSGITLPDSVTVIDDYAFSQCGSLEYVNHSGRLTYVGSNAFHYAKSLRSFDFPKTLKTLGGYAFSNCETLGAAELKWVTNIGRNCFENCYLLKTIDLSSVAYTIPSAAFAWCTSLTDIKLADTVTYIGEAAFINNNLVKSIKLPGELVTLGASAFYGCTSLDGLSFGDKLETIGIQAFSECTALRSVVLPQSVTRIGENAFEGCTALSEFVMNEGLSEIGSYAFAGCSSLLNITLPESLEVIPEGCFTGSALVDVRAGSRVKVISGGAFAGCSFLKFFEVGTLVGEIGEQAFDYCENFKYFMYDGGEAMFARINIGEGNDYLYAAYRNYLNR